MKKVSIFTTLIMNLWLLPANPVEALVIDTLDANIGYVAETDLGATDNVAVLIQGETDQAVQLNYNFATTNSFSQLTKTFSLLNIGELARNQYAIRFYARGTGQSNTVRFRLTDKDGDQFFKTFANLANNQVWQQVIIPLTDFTLTTVGDGIFDLFRVKQIECAIEKNAGGINAFDIDKIELVRTTVQTSSITVLDDFEGGTGSPNRFVGPIGTFTQDTNASLSATYDSSLDNVLDGNFSLRLSYNAGTLTTVDNAGYFNGPNGANLTAGSQIEFYAKSTNDNDGFRIKFGSTTQNQVINIGGIGKTWKKFIIPYENFDQVVSSGVAGQVGFTSVTEFVFIFTPNVSQASGNIWIDNIQFVTPAAAIGTIRTIDNMEETTLAGLTTWTSAQDGASSANIESIADGIDGRALRLNCNLKDGNFCTMTKQFFINSTLTDSIRFKFKYSGTLLGARASNDFQFNILDTDNVHFKGDIPNLTDTNGLWKNMTIPLSQFKEVTGGNSLDLRKIDQMRLTLLKDDGGEGIFAVDDLEFINAPKVPLGSPGQLIQLLAADNNPFSPNNDGIKDTVTFTYDIRESAKVRLRIYNTKGVMIKEFDPTSITGAGLNSFVWNGRDQTNSRVKNGLYFYQLKADSVQCEQKGRETGVVAVLR